MYQLKPTSIGDDTCIYIHRHVYIKYKLSSTIITPFFRLISYLRILSYTRQQTK